MNGESVDVAAVAGRDVEQSGIPAAGPLVALVEAAVARDATALAAARADVTAAVGEAGLVDACAVLGNFERMTRIADGTGIPLDTPARMLSDDLAEKLDLNRFESAGHSGALPTWARVLAPLVRRVAPRLLPRIGARVGR